MDERRQDIASPLAEGSGAAAAPAPPPAAKRSWKGPLGVALALVISFAWGALAYRELGTAARVTSPIAMASVAGSESPPGWVADFAAAFCSADGAHIASRIGPPLSGQTAQIEEALASRAWSCSDTRYLGGGTNRDGQFYAYVTMDDNGGEQWWVFTVVDDKVVAIE